MHKMSDILSKYREKEMKNKCEFCGGFIGDFETFENTFGEISHLWCNKNIGLYSNLYNGRELTKILLGSLDNASKKDKKCHVCSKLIGLDYTIYSDVETNLYHIRCVEGVGFNKEETVEPPQDVISEASLEQLKRFETLTEELPLVLSLIVARDKGLCRVCGSFFCHKDSPFIEHYKDSNYIHKTCNIGITHTSQSTVTNNVEAVRTQNKIVFGVKDRKKLDSFKELASKLKGHGEELLVANEKKFILWHL